MVDGVRKRHFTLAQCMGEDAVFDISRYTCALKYCRGKMKWRNVGGEQKKKQNEIGE